MNWPRTYIKRDLKNYSSKFEGQDQTLEEFSEQKRRVNESKEWIKVKVKDLSVFRTPGKDEMVVVTFEQDYQSNNLNNTMKKLQYWIREDRNWKIAYEGAS